MNKCILILALVILSGCTRNLSNRPPFNEYVGRDLITLRPTHLYEMETWVSELDLWLNPPSPHLAIIETNHPYFSPKEIISYVPSNTPVRINKVTLFIGDGMTWVRAMGVLDPNRPEKKEVIFTWGGDRELYRAPWEPTSVPERRHFDHLYKKQIEPEVRAYGENAR